MKLTHYEALGIVETATLEQIKAAFRARAKATHPDTNPGNPKAAENFKAVSEAHEILKDNATRAAYDAQLRAERARAAAQPPAGGFSAQPPPAPPQAGRAPRTGMSVGEAAAWFVIACAAGEVLKGAFGGKARWDRSVGRYRARNGQFAPG